MAVALPVPFDRCNPPCISVTENIKNNVVQNSQNSEKHMEVNKVKLLWRQNWEQEPLCLTGHASVSLAAPRSLQSQAECL